MLTIWCKI